MGFVGSRDCSADPEVVLAYSISGTTASHETGTTMSGTLCQTIARGTRSSAPPFTDDHMRVLNQLRRLPENKNCGTCGYEERMGFKDVCMKFKIFICTDCKSGHQAYSHRCKVPGIAFFSCFSLSLLAI